MYQFVWYIQFCSSFHFLECIPPAFINLEIFDICFVDSLTKVGKSSSTLHVPLKAVANPAQNCCG